MVSNKQSRRAFIAFLVTWSFAVLSVTGLVLYIVPQGRVAFWTHWSLLGLGKTDWGNVHMLFGGVFIVTGILHLYFNWKPFKKYLAERVKGHLELKRELVTSLGATLLLVAAALANLPRSVGCSISTEQSKIPGQASRNTLPHSVMQKRLPCRRWPSAPTSIWKLRSVHLPRRVSTLPIPGQTWCKSPATMTQPRRRSMH